MNVGAVLESSHSFNCSCIYLPLTFNCLSLRTRIRGMQLQHFDAEQRGIAARSHDAGQLVI